MLKQNKANQDNDRQAELKIVSSINWQFETKQESVAGW